MIKLCNCCGHPFYSSNCLKADSDQDACKGCQDYDDVTYDEDNNVWIG